MPNNPFLEERIDVNALSNGASYCDDYEVEITAVKGGSEYRRLLNPFPVRTFRFAYLIEKDIVYTEILNLWHKCYGQFKGFRVRCMDDFSTNNFTGVPTAFDQSLLKISSGVYQLRKIYGTSGGERTIFKPVSGTTKVAIGALAILNSPIVNWSVDTTTGKVTFGANKGQALTGITKAAQAVATVGSHAFAPGEYAYLSGVSGMTEINGKRGLITAVGGLTITVDINSTGFSTYTSGGMVNTQPQTGETVSGGCEFDVPVRFNTKVEVGLDEFNLRSIDGVELIELINP